MVAGHEAAGRCDLSTPASAVCGTGAERGKEHHRNDTRYPIYVNSIGSEECLDLHAGEAPPNGPGEAIPGLRLAVEAFNQATAALGCSLGCSPADISAAGVQNGWVALVQQSRASKSLVSRCAAVATATSSTMPVAGSTDVCCSAAGSTRRPIAGCRTGGVRREGWLNLTIPPPPYAR